MAEYTTEFEGGIPIIKYSGSITSLMAAPMPGIGELVNSGYKKIIFDASSVSYINSQGLSTLINTHRYCNRQNVQMVFAGAKPDVMKVIRVARANLFIPIFDDVKTALKEIQYVSGTGLQSKTRENIVVIQKNIQLADNLKDCLHQAHQVQNYDITTHTDPHEASEYLKTNEGHLVIIEVNFEIKEIEAFVAAMATNPGLSVIPILVATPKARYEKAFEFVLNGADDFLPHPFDEFETPTRIRNLLELYYLVKSGAGSGQLSGLKFSRTKSTSSHPGGMKNP